MTAKKQTGKTRKTAKKPPAKRKAASTVSKTDNTVEKTDKRKTGAHLFQKGNSANPHGRPKGSRNKFSEAFCNALLKDFEEHGAATLERVRILEPAKYLAVAAKIVGKEVEINHNNASFDRLWSMVSSKVFADNPHIIEIIEEIEGETKH